MESGHTPIDKSMKPVGSSRSGLKWLAAIIVAALVCAVFWHRPSAHVSNVDANKTTAVDVSVEPRKTSSVNFPGQAASPHKEAPPAQETLKTSAVPPVSSESTSRVEVVAITSPAIPKETGVHEPSGRVTAALNNPNYPGGTQSAPELPPDHRPSAEILASWSLPTVEADVVVDNESTSTDDVEDAAFQTAGDSGNGQDSATTFAKLLEAFKKETNPERRQDLLAAAQLLSEKGQSLRSLIAVAFEPSQPVEVQRQALYLASHFDIEIARQVAANPNSPLQVDAEAFVLQDQIANGVDQELIEE